MLSGRHSEGLPDRGAEEEEDEHVRQAADDPGGLQSDLAMTAGVQ
jgi:hypothetical protein